MLRKTNEVVAMKFPRNHRKKLTSLSSSCGTTTAAGQGLPVPTSEVGLALGCQIACAS